LTVLSRDVDHLMGVSIRRLLSDKEAANLIKYFDLTEKLKVQEKQEVAELTDEELRRMVGDGQK
jgi:hypothetical protein